MPRLTLPALAPLAVVLLGAARARAHGHQARLCIGQGECLSAYDAGNAQNPDNNPGTWPYNTNAPIPNPQWDTDLMACNQYSGEAAKPGTGYYTANAGDEIKVQMTPWNATQGANHHWGPTVAYIADCKGDCTTLNASAPNTWTKIYEAGWIESQQKWASQVINENNDTWIFRLPEDLKTGKYLLRPEVISLQFSRYAGSTQLFMACHNFEITGAGGGGCVPTGSVSFPGSYNNSGDSFVYNIWTEQDVTQATNMTSYVPPGGAVWPGCNGAAGGGTEQPAPYKSMVPQGGMGRTGNTGAIIGGVIGGVGGLLLLLLCLWCCCWRKRAIEQAECDAKEQQNAVLAAAIVADQKDGSLFDRESLAHSRANSKGGKTPTSAQFPPYAAAPPGSMYNGDPRSVYGPDGVPPAYAPSMNGSAHSYGYAPSHVAPSAYSGSARSWAPPPSTVYGPPASHYAGSAVSASQRGPTPPSSHYAGSAHSHRGPPLPSPTMYGTGSAYSTGGRAPPATVYAAPSAFTAGPPMSRSASYSRADGSARSHSDWTIPTRAGRSHRPAGSARSSSESDIGASRAAPSSQWSRSRYEATVREDDVSARRYR